MKNSHLLRAKSCACRCMDLLKSTDQESFFVRSNEMGGQLTVDSFDQHSSGLADCSTPSIDREDVEGVGAEGMSIITRDMLNEYCTLLLIYIFLDLADFVQAEALSRALLSGPLSEENKLLVELMYVESLCHTGRYDEANLHIASMIHPTRISSSSRKYFTEMFRGGKLISETAAVKAIVMLNRGISLIHVGKLYDARPVVEEVLSLAPQCPIAIKALIYINLRCGCPSQLLSLLKTSRNTCLSISMSAATSL